jgi:hypothetical protein
MQVEIIYTRYRTGLESSSALEKEDLNQSITEKLKTILTESPILAQDNPSRRRSNWEVIFNDPKLPVETIDLKCHRTPRNMPGSVNHVEDSGIYVAYAMECDYYDSPIYVPGDNWSNIRKNFCHYLLKNDLPHMTASI